MAQLLQQAETGSSLIQEKSHTYGCAWSGEGETEKEQGPAEKGIGICFSWSQRYVDNILWDKQSSPFSGSFSVTWFRNVCMQLLSVFSTNYLFLEGVRRQPGGWIMLTPVPPDLCLVPYKEQNEQDLAMAPALSALTNTICKGTPQLCAPGLFILPWFSLLAESHLRNEDLWTCKIDNPFSGSWIKCLLLRNATSIENSGN